MTDVIYWHGDIQHERVLFGPKNIAANLPLYQDELIDEFEWVNGSSLHRLAYGILRTYFEVSCGYPIHFCRKAAIKYLVNFTIEVVGNFGSTWVISSLYIAKWICRKWKENLI